MFKLLRSVLEMNEIPKPKLVDNHVLIETHYAGIQYPDALQAQGLYQGTFVQRACVCMCVQIEEFHFLCLTLLGLTVNKNANSECAC